MERKCLSIITNFGCHYKCPYCIVKKNGINVPKTTVESLDNFLKTFKNGKYDYISLSGGGDPMFEFDKHRDYYDKLFSICKENNITIELHTSYIKEIENKLPFELFERIVFHCNSIDDVFEAEDVNCEDVPKRVVFVIEDRMSTDYINTVSYIVDNCCYEVDQLSFRQRIEQDYKTNYHLHNFLKAGHQMRKWYYIEQGDYNTYFINGDTINKYSELRNNI